MILVIRAIQAKTSEPKSKTKPAVLERVKVKGEADAHVRERLITLLDGDWEKAEMLVARKRFAKEGRHSENYYWWLVIREVERKRKRM